MNAIQEITRAARALVREPGMAVLAVLALGLGIGLPTAMFGIVDAALFRGLSGVPDAREIMHLEGRPQGGRGEGWGASPADYRAWREQQRSFEELGAYRTATMALRSESGTDRWSAGLVTPSVFTVLATAAEVGRTFRTEDARPGADPVALLSHRVWRDRFGGDPSILGRTVWLDGQARTVVGVMPERFRFPVEADVWVPLALTAADASDPGDRSLGVVGRLRDAVGLEQARGQMALIAARMAAEHPETHEDWGIAVKPITSRYLGETPAFQLKLVLGAVLLVLLVACTNVANLLLVRAAGRMREMGIRSALGGSRGRIIRHVLLESTVLAAAGAALGAAVAAAALAATERTFGEQLPPWMELGLNGAVLAFALGLTAAAALLAGVLPAVRATGGSLTDILRDSSRGTTGLRLGRLMRSLVVLQVALSFGLMVTTGLLAVTVRNVQDLDFGFGTEDVLTARVTLPDRYGDDERIRFFEELTAAVAAEPGVAEATVATALPVDHAQRWRVAVEGRVYEEDGHMPVVRRAAVDPGFFRTFDLQPLEGRVLEPRDRGGSLPVVVVNRAFAGRHLTGDSPIGRRIRFGDAANSTGASWLTVVGVVPDLWMGALDNVGDRNPPGVYVPLAQAPPVSATLAARVRGGSPLSLTPAVREAAFALDRDVPIYDVRSFPEMLEDNSWFYGWAASIMTAAGLTALLLAGIGLYGVMAFWVRGRRREIGIRAACGATPRRLLGLVLARGGAYLGIGMALGLGLALFLAGGLSALLFGVNPTDPVVVGGIALFLTGVGAAAILVPALRAARTDPMEVLRAE